MRYLMFVAVLSGCFDPKSRPKDNCGVEADWNGQGATAVEVHAAGAGIGLLWLSAKSSEICCSDGPGWGAKDRLAVFDIHVAHEGDNEVVPCTDGVDWASPCGSGKVEGRYYHSGGVAGGTGTLHIDPVPAGGSTGHMTGTVDVTFVDGEKRWRLRANFNAPSNCVTH